MECVPTLDTEKPNFSSPIVETAALMASFIYILVINVGQPDADMHVLIVVSSEDEGYFFGCLTIDAAA